MKYLSGRKIGFPFHLVFLAGFVFFSLSAKPLPSEVSQKDAKYGGTVIVGLNGDFDSFNELNASDSDAIQVIEKMLFLTLTKLDENLEIVPCLAESWDVEEDGRILTYSLRKDVAWTDGRPTTAEDVLFTYQMAIHPDVAYPAASRFNMTENVEVLDPHTVRFVFKKGYPDALFDTQMPVLPKHILGKIAPEDISQCDFNRNPVGNGPFQMVEWKANRHVIFQSNPEYPFGRPYLDRVIFSILPDATALLTNLKTGDIDICPVLSARDYQTVRSNPSLEMSQYQSRGYTFIAWNCARPKLTQNVRTALTHAIDKQEIIDTLMDGFAKPANGPIMPFVWAYDQDLKDLPHDLNLSRQLFKEAGWEDTDNDGLLDKDGESFEISIKTNAGSQSRRDMAVLLQAQLKKIGIKVNIDVVDFNLLLDQVFSEKNFDALLSGWDADFTVNPTDLFHSQAIKNGYNFISYKNPKIDELLESGRATIDRDRAKEIWSQFQRIIIAESPYTFLFVQDELAGINKRVRGVDMDVRGFLCNVHSWWIPKEKRR